MRRTYDTKGTTFFLLVLISFGICTSACCQSVEFVDGNYLIQDKDETFSKVTVLESNQDQTVLDIDIYRLIHEKKLVDAKEYDVLSLPGYAYTEAIGKPQLPAIREALAIPDGASVSVKILEINDSLYQDYNVYPVQPPQTDEADVESQNVSTEFVIDRDFYAQNTSYPEDIVKTYPPGTFRDLDIVNIEVNPVSFNPSKGEIEVINHIKIALEYTQNLSEGVKAELGKKVIDPMFDEMYSNSILNYDFIDREVMAATPSSNVSVELKLPTGLENLGYIDDPVDVDSAPVILSLRKEDRSTFEAISPLLDWHDSHGQSYISVYYYTSTVVTDAMIKDTITSYYNFYPSLKYVIIWGDISFMPWHVDSSTDAPGDYWYSLMTGDDLYPELAVGRMSVDGVSEIQNVVTKTLFDLNNRPTANWAKKALLVAHKESDSSGLHYQKNKEAIRTASYANSFTFSHLYGAPASMGGDAATNAMVNSAINAGLGIVNYRGHGSETSWASWNVANEYYTTTNAGSLANTIKPVVFGICCRNAWLDYASQTLAEAFTKPLSRGAVAYFSASRDSYTFANDFMDMYIFDAMGNKNLRQIGLITNDAKSRMVTKFGPDSDYMYNVKIYLWLGDPALPVSATPSTLPSKIGIFRNGGLYFDANGDRYWSTGDTTGWFGGTGDIPVAGDWNNDGRDEIAIFRNGGWYFDANGDRYWSTGDTTGWLGGPGDIPVAGDWNNDGIDEIAIFRNGGWYFDANGDRYWSTGDTTGWLGGTGDIPVAGDWNNDGRDEIAIFRNGGWYFDANGDRYWSAGDTTGWFGGAGDKPFAGRWS